MPHAQTKIPRLARGLLRLCVAPELGDRVTGDLEELFTETLTLHGSRRAQLAVWREVLVSCAPLLLDRVHRWFLLLGNQLRVGVRRLARQRVFAAINLMGLSIGIGSCLLVLLYVRDERSFDSHFADADRLYRVAMRRHASADELRTAATPRPLGETLSEMFPEVEAVTRLSRERTEQVLVRSGAETSFEERFVFADSNFFDFFQIGLVRGEPARALATRRYVVLTTETARRYFDNANPVGKTLSVRLRGDGTWFDYTITGVVRPMPANSHFHFDFLAAYDGHPFAFDSNGAERLDWTGPDVYTYVRLVPGSDPENLRAKLPLVVDRHVLPFVRSRGPDQGGGEASYAFFLQAVPEIHLASGLRGEFEPGGNGRTVRVLSLVAALILVLAAINFVNLSTARASRRAREVGIRKAMGSGRGQLAGQFLVESVLLATASFILAVAMSEAALPWFNALTGKRIPSTFGGSFETTFLMFGLSVAVGLSSGLYPAAVLSSFAPARVLRGSIGAGSGGRRLIRSSLVLLQFGVATAMIVGTAMIFAQMTFIGRKDLGFEKEHVVIVNETHVLRESIEPFRESLLALPGVLEAAPAEAVPGRALGESRYYMASDAAQTTETTLSRMYAGFGFVETLGIRIVEGRSISRDRSGDSTAVMLNVSAVRALGVADPIGKELVRSDGEVAYTVVGVVEDYHFESLKNRIGPLAVFGPDPFFANRPRQIVAVRIDDADVSRVVDRIAGKWADFVPEQPFRYGFLDEEFDALYRAERRAESLFSIFCGLAIVVACLGLFGLAAHTIEERSKEIAVRKILGATSYGVAGMLIRDLSRPVLIAFLVAAPPSYVAARAWLDTFAYRTDTTWQILVATGIVLAATTVFTVGMQAVRSASTPPAATLAAE